MNEAISTLTLQIEDGNKLQKLCFQKKSIRVCLLKGQQKIELRQKSKQELKTD